MNDTVLLSRYGAKHPARPLAVLIVAVLTAALGAAVCAASVLVPAPPDVLPLVVAVCIGCPMFAVWDLPAAVASLRAQRARDSAKTALARLRRNLDELPETDHPLGL